MHPHFLRFSIQLNHRNPFDIAVVEILLVREQSGNCRCVSNIYFGSRNLKVWAEQELRNMEVGIRRMLVLKPLKNVYGIVAASRQSAVFAR